MSSYLATPLSFLIDTVFSLFIFALLLRFLFQWCGADPRNPVSQFLIRVTHPPLRVLRRLIPSFGRVDSACILLMVGLQTLSSFLILLVRGENIPLGVVSILAVSQLVELILNVYFYAIIIRSLLSWFGPTAYNPAISLLFSLTEPLLYWSRRILPPTGGIDLSPLVPLVVIQLARMMVLPPLQELAYLLN
ncbi:MAG TPA: YggT family protein [Methylococcaceae bacterium]|jgi:YggT family protein|nr:YggT family protein [Methylococcaceae bacterium]